MKQEQLLARRDELAQEYHLGELEMYRTPWTSEGWAIYVVVIASVALALIVLVTIINGQAQDAIFTLVMGGSFYLIFLSDHTSVYVYSNGLVCLRRSGGRVVHWGEIRKVWMSGGGRGGAVLNAMLNDGTKIRFPVISSQGSASYRDIQQFIEENMPFVEKLPDQ